MKMFKVTVTPKVVTYGSHGCNGEYSVDIYAKDRSAAISKAREQFTENFGRPAISGGATYKATVLTEGCR